MTEKEFMSLDILPKDGFHKTARVLISEPIFRQIELKIITQQEVIKKVYELLGGINIHIHPDCYKDDFYEARELLKSLLEDES